MGYWKKRIAEEKAQKEEAEKAARKARKDAKKDEDLLQTDVDQDMVNEDEGLLQSEEHEHYPAPWPLYCDENRCFWTYDEVLEYKAKEEEAEKQERRAARRAAKKARKDAKKDEDLLQTDADQDMVNEDEGLLQSEEHGHYPAPCPLYCDE